MKRVILFISVFIFSLQSFAQDSDISLTLDWGNTWNQYIVNVGEKNTFIISEEVEIDAYDYYNDIYNRELYYRQENNKIYRYTIATHTGNIVLDFGLQKNDIFTHSDGRDWIVDNVSDTVLVGLENTRLCIFLHEVDNPQNTDIWIEGIGSIHYGINPPISTTEIKDYYLLSFSTSNWDAYVFTFETGNLCNKIVEPGTVEKEANSSDEIINVSLINNTLYIEGKAWYDGAGLWYMFAEEKDGVVNLLHRETVPDADGMALRQFSAEFSGFNQKNYDVYYNGQFITAVENITDINRLSNPTTSLSLHREGDHVMAVFPAVGVGEAVTLYDTTGRVVASQPLRQGATTATIDIAHLPQGVYIAHVGNTISAKVVL